MCAWLYAKTKERPSLCQEITVFKHQWDRRCVVLMTWKNVASNVVPHLPSSFCEALKKTLHALFFSIVWKLKHKIVCNYQQINLLIFLCPELISCGKVWWKQAQRCCDKFFVEIKTCFSLNISFLGSWQASAKLSNVNPPTMEHYSTRSSGFSGWI